MMCYLISHTTTTATNMTGRNWKSSANDKLRCRLKPVAASNSVRNTSLSVASTEYLHFILAALLSTIQHRSVMAMGNRSNIVV